MAHPPAPGPHPKGSRKKLVAPPSRCGREASLMVTGRARLAGRPILRPSAPAPRRTCAGPREPSRHPTPVDPPGPTPSRPLARRLPSRVLDATKLIFVSLRLADECYRPNCQRAWPHLSRTPPARGRVRGRRRRVRLVPSHTTPSAGVRCLWATHPGRDSAIGFIREARAIITGSPLESNPSAFFSKSLRVAGVIDIFGRSLAARRPPPPAAPGGSHGRADL